MILHSLTATFGCLNNATLELKEGLNVIQAPNESGKSTWLAFLRTMLYGLPTRERGTLADKNRYAPWNGAAMKGRIDLSAEGCDLVLIRDTAQSGTPMGHFSATYSGTANQVDGMTGQNAGDLLTGVPRSVFERSAFIRQSGLAIDQDAELEKRIVSLISSGDETTSYSETKKRLRNALNQRRHNKTGTLPRTEAELADLQDKLDHLQAVQQENATDRLALEEIDASLRQIAEQLQLHTKMDIVEAKQELFSTKSALQEAEAAVASLKAEIESAKIPAAEQLMRIKFNAANLLTTQVSMNHVQSQAEDAKKQTAAAQAAVDKTIFAPADPETAAEKVRTEMETYQKLMQHAAPSIPIICLLTVLTAAALGGAAYLMQQSYFLCAGAVIVPLLLTAVRSSSRKRAQKNAADLLIPYGVSAPEEIEPLLIDYNNVYHTLMEQKETEAQINASWRSFYQTYKKLSEEILDETSSFCPDIQNIHEVSPLLDSGLRKWKQLQVLSNRAAQLHERFDVLQAQVPDHLPLTEEELHMTRPIESREILQQQYEAIAAQQQELRSRIDRSTGEMSVIGDHTELDAQLERLNASRNAAQEEYDAIVLALDALEEANSELQNRFSPALGKRAGEIFSALTDNRYQHVLLNQDLHAFAEGEDAIARDAGFLSQGANDQLYLAVRLAICEKVLPKEKSIPLFLDDTLTNFDETRMAAALDWLKEEAKTRQILLFTCQSREAVYLQNEKNVHIISLSGTRRH